jgi:hypothetical protein
MQAVDIRGEVALMLCESLLHVLVEEKVISREKALEAIEGIAELVREIDERRGGPAKTPSAGLAAMTLVQNIAESFAAKGETRSTAAAKRSRDRRRARADKGSGKA